MKSRNFTYRICRCTRLCCGRDSWETHQTTCQLGEQQKLFFCPQQSCAEHPEDVEWSAFQRKHKNCLKSERPVDHLIKCSTWLSNRGVKNHISRAVSNSHSVSSNCTLPAPHPPASSSSNILYAPHPMANLPPQMPFPFSMPPFDGMPMPSPLFHPNFMNFSNNGMPMPMSMPHPFYGFPPSFMSTDPPPNAPTAPEAGDAVPPPPSGPSTSMSTDPLSIAPTAPESDEAVPPPPNAPSTSESDEAVPPPPNAPSTSGKEEEEKRRKKKTDETRPPPIKKQDRRESPKQRKLATNMLADVFQMPSFRKEKKGCKTRGVNTRTYKTANSSTQSTGPKDKESRFTKLTITVTLDKWGRKKPRVRIIDVD